MSLLADLGSGRRLTELSGRYGGRDYKALAYYVDRAKKEVGAKTVAHAVAIGIRMGWLSEPTGVSMQVFPTGRMPGVPRR